MQETSHENSASGLPAPAFSSGFSLIEIVAVVIVIGILATIAIVKFSGVQSVSARAAAFELRAHLGFIRNTSVSCERAMRVRFYVVSNSYDVCVAVSNWKGDYVPAKDPVTQEGWLVDIGAKFRDAALDTVNINSNSILYFNETNGAPYAAGWQPLAATGIITFNSGQKITVTPLTGHTAVE